MDTAVCKVSVAVNAVQKHHKAIPIWGSATESGISSGTGRSESAALGIPAARADTSVRSYTLDAYLGD